MCGAQTLQLGVQAVALASAAVHQLPSCGACFIAALSLVQTCIPASCLPVRTPPFRTRQASFVMLLTSSTAAHALHSRPAGWHCHQSVHHSPGCCSLDRCMLVPTCACKALNSCVRGAQEVELAVQAAALLSAIAHTTVTYLPGALAAARRSLLQF